MSRNIDNILDFTGATYRQLCHWVDRAWLHPIERGRTGVPRQWTPGELDVARHMAQLVAAGITPEAAHYAARHGGLLPGDRFRVDYTDDADHVAASHGEEVRRESA